MKKLLALLLAMVMVLSMAACGGKVGDDSGNKTPAKNLQVVEMEIEASGLEELTKVTIGAPKNMSIEENDWNIVFTDEKQDVSVEASSISVDYCLMDVMYTYEKAAKVFMETSVLANLNKGDIKVVTGVIASAEEDGYIIDEARIEEQNVADEVIHNYINQISHYPRVMFMNHNMFLIGQCMSEHPEKYGFSSQAETEAFMTATWEGFQYNPNGTGRNIYNLKMSPTGAMINGSLVQVSGNIQLTYYSNVKAPHIYFSSVNKGIYESGDLYKMSETYMLIYSCNYWTGSETWCLLERSK